MIGRFFGFVADGLDEVARRLLPATDLQVAAAERGQLFVAALNDVEAEHDGLPEPAEAMTPDVDGCVECGHNFDQHPSNAGIHNPCNLCSCVDYSARHSSAASIPPGASDASPVQERPHPAPGYPNPLPACEAGSEGSGVDSDIPQSATPERPTSRSEFDAGYLAAVEVLERLSKADRKLAADQDDEDMAFQFLHEANCFEGTAVYLRGCLKSSKRIKPAN